MVEAFKQHLQRTLSPGTATAYTGWVRRYDAWLTSTDRDPVSDPRALRDFLASLLRGGDGRNGIKPATVHVARAAVESLNAWLRDEGHPVVEQKTPEIPTQTVAVTFTPSAAEVAKIEAIALTYAIPYGAAIALLPHTGLRASEMCALRTSDVRQAGTGAEGRYIVHVSNAKNHRARNVPVTRRGCDILAAYLEDRAELTQASSDWLFPTRQGKAIARKELEDRLRDIRVRAGVPDATNHCFRRHYATQAILAGVQAAEVAKFLGHANLGTLDRYHQPTAEQQVGQLEKAGL